MPELPLILVVALPVFGPSKLGELGRSGRNDSQLSIRDE